MKYNREEKYTLHEVFYVNILYCFLCYHQMSQISSCVLLDMRTYNIIMFISILRSIPIIIFIFIFIFITILTVILIIISVFNFILTFILIRMKLPTL